MGTWLKQIWMLMTLALVTGAGLAAEASGRIAVTPLPPKEGWTIGDAAEFRVPREYPAGTRPPVLVRQFPESVALVGETPGEVKTAGNRVTDTRSLRLAFFQTGDISTGSIRYTGERPGGLLEFRAAALTVKIRPLRPEQDDQPDAAEPPWVIPYPTLKLVGLIGGSLLILAALAWLVWYLVRRKQAGRGEVAIPPHLEARDRLQQLAGQDLPRQGRLREFYFSASEIVKDYLGKELAVVVLERTTSEILAQLPDQAALTEGSREMVRRFLLSGDPVKFARHLPPSAEVDDYLRAAFEIVHQVHEEAEDHRRRVEAPQPEAPAPPAEGAAS